MKVIQVNTVCDSSSTGKIAVNLYQLLRNNGYECKVAYGRRTPRNVKQEDIIKIGTKFNFVTHAVKAVLSDRSGFYSTWATKKFLAELDEYQPDVLHLHNLHGFYINIDLLFQYIKQNNIGVIWTLHDCWSFTGHCAYFEKNKCTKWKYQCENCELIREYPLSLLVDHSKKNYLDKRRSFQGVSNLTILTPSKWLGGLVKHSILKEYPVMVVPNGINLEVIKPTEGMVQHEDLIQGKKVILGVANIWEKRKGLVDFIKLSTMLEEKEYIIVLIGLNKRQINRLPKSIVGIERLSTAEELCKWYTKASVLVNPTYGDNFPTVNIEALACGTPVVTYQTGGSGESIATECGRVVEQGNIMLMKRAIEEVAQKAEQMKTACIQVATMYDKEKCYKQYLELLKHNELKCCKNLDVHTENGKV